MLIFNKKFAHAQQNNFFFLKEPPIFKFKFELCEFFQATLTFKVLLCIQNLLIENELNFQFITFVFIVFFCSLLRFLQLYK
jgi:hypothetical protein